MAVLLLLCLTGRALGPVYPIKLASRINRGWPQTGSTYSSPPCASVHGRCSRCVCWLNKQARTLTGDGENDTASLNAGAGRTLVSDTLLGTRPPPQPILSLQVDDDPCHPEVTVSALPLVSYRQALCPAAGLTLPTLQTWKLRPSKRKNLT